jgi:hypothetical protein
MPKGEEEAEGAARGGGGGEALREAECLRERRREHGHRRAAHDGDDARADRAPAEGPLDDGSQADGAAAGARAPACARVTLGALGRDERVVPHQLVGLCTRVPTPLSGANATRSVFRRKGAHLDGRGELAARDVGARSAMCGARHLNHAALANAHHEVLAPAARAEWVAAIFARHAQLLEADEAAWPVHRGRRRAAPCRRRARTRRDRTRARRDRTRARRDHRSWLLASALAPPMA